VASTFEVYVVPSRYEGLGRALTEAMASGRPVVATAVNGVPDLVEPGVTGLLAAPGAVLSWAPYVVGGGGIPGVLPPATRTPEALLQAIAPPALLVGEALPALAGRFDGWAARSSLAARADARALLAVMGRPGGAVRIDDPAGWEPTYGRPAEAQARWEAQHGRPLHHPPGTAG
jgi:hypothetical protein